MHQCIRFAALFAANRMHPVLVEIVLSPQAIIGASRAIRIQRDVPTGKRDRLFGNGGADEGERTCSFAANGCFCGLPGPKIGPSFTI
jgi:hypothetical protein